MFETEQAILRLRAEGRRVGIDHLDVRTARLEALAALPVEFIKIDRSPTDVDEPAELDKRAAVSAAARSLKIATVATNVATLPELAAAIAHEYDFAQGSLFGVQIAAAGMPRGEETGTRGEAAGPVQ
jgi:EAL domain-containing protein (putative c-di-GMP-specific phosphodiesterase class I)